MSKIFFHLLKVTFERVAISCQHSIYQRQLYCKISIRMLIVGLKYVNILNIQSTCLNLWFSGVCVIENAQISSYSHIEKKFDFGKFVKGSRIREQKKTNKGNKILLWLNTFSTKSFRLQYMWTTRSKNYKVFTHTNFQENKQDSSEGWMWMAHKNKYKQKNYQVIPN